MYKLFLKRIFDLSLILITSPILLPIGVIISIILFYQNKRGIFFTQIRPGKDEKLFKIFKFKTMRDEFNEKGELLPDSERLTRFGKILRKASLDELPQIINVLLGHMSIIGPRPLLNEYLPYYSKHQKLRHTVKPGITGWAQVNGRQTIRFSQRLEYDIWYTKNLSFKLDLYILILTIVNVFKTEGVINGQNVYDVDDLGFTDKIKSFK